MRSKLALSALVIASLLGATAVASAQTQPAPGASTESKMAAGATTHKMKSGNENQQDEIRRHHRDEFRRPQDPQGRQGQHEQVVGVALIRNVRQNGPGADRGFCADPASADQCLWW